MGCAAFTTIRVSVTMCIGLWEFFCLLCVCRGDWEGIERVSTLAGVCVLWLCCFWLFGYIPIDAIFFWWSDGWGEVCVVMHMMMGGMVVII